MAERFGIASQPRPDGTLIWIHGASVGECLAVLPLVSKLLEKDGRHILVTSGTVTSAQLLAERLPAGALHQYAPIDRSDAVRRFLAHWRPDLALFVESELWPNRILEVHEAGIPIALVNARLSPKSVRNWQRMGGAARRLFSCIDICLAQDARIAEQLRSLGAPSVSVSGSLKADAPPLPVDDSALSAFREAAGNRPIFLAAQTHPGEDEIVLDAAERAAKEIPTVLTVIVPRHPERGKDIAALARARGLSCARRSGGEQPNSQTQIYVADTLGELGLFYRCAPFVFLGGSLAPRGGHNPLEPAALGICVLTGPHTENFEETFGTLLTAQGNTPIADAEDLSRNAVALLKDPALAAERGAKANAAIAELTGALDRTADAAEQLLTRHARA